MRVGVEFWDRTRGWISVPGVGVGFLDWGRIRVSEPSKGQVSGPGSGLGFGTGGRGWVWVWILGLRSGSGFRTRSESGFETWIGEFGFRNHVRVLG